MLSYINLKTYKKTNTLNKLWNREFKHQYPINAKLFKNRILSDVNFNKDASFVALYDGEAVGFIFVKTWKKDSGLFNDFENAHISLIFVKRELRNMGIGSDLLKLALGEIKKYATIKRVIVGETIHSLFPGVPNELSNCSVFFLNKGFIQKEGIVDMISVVRKSYLQEENKMELNVRIATEEDKDEILKLCIFNNKNKEAFRLDEYFEKGGTGRRIAVACDKDGKILVLSRFNDTNKLNFSQSDRHTGSIDFILIDKSLNKEEYEIKMLQVTRNYLIKRGCKKIVTINVNDQQFYKEQGYSTFKRYQNFEYTIKK